MFGRKSRRIAALEAEVAELEVRCRLVDVRRRRAVAVASLLADREPPSGVAAARQMRRQ